MANIYCWLYVESPTTGSSSGRIMYCGKEKQCVDYARSLDIFSGEVREYIAWNAKWLADKVTRKFRVRIIAGGEDEQRVERKINLKVLPACG